MLFQITRHWSSVEHTHANDASATETTKLRVQLKRKATDTSEPPSRLLAEALTETSEQVRANVGDLETIRRDLRRQRSKVRPPEPSTLRDLHVQDTWATTGGARPQPFLLYDNGQERQDRMLVFSTHEQLAALSSSRTWYMDGTFSVCPRIFRQLYVLRCKLGDSSLACVYALLSGKSLSTYEELFQVILDSCEEKGYHPDPAVIISDYEIAAMKAAKEVFGEHVTTRGCFFHLCQSTHRKVSQTEQLYFPDIHSVSRIRCVTLKQLPVMISSFQKSTYTRSFNETNIKMLRVTFLDISEWALISFEE